MLDIHRAPILLVSRHAALLGALLLTTITGCNFSDSQANAGGECASNDDCEATQLCSIQGQCVNLQTGVMDMIQGTTPDMPAPQDMPQDMPPDLVADLSRLAEDLGPPDMDMNAADQPLDMTPPVDMSSALPPPSSRYTLADMGAFAFRAAASGEGGELSLVGNSSEALFHSSSAIFIYQDSLATLTGFEIQSEGRVQLLDVAQHNDRVMAVGTVTQDRAGNWESGMWISINTRNGEFEHGQHRVLQGEQMRTQAVAGQDTQWLFGGVLGQDHERFFVARVRNNGDVDRAREFLPPAIAREPATLRLVALRADENNVYSMVQSSDGAGPSTFITRMRDGSLSPEWSVEFEDNVMLYDMVISQDLLYVVGHIHDTTTGVSAILNTNNGSMVGSFSYEGQHIRGIAREDDSTFWALSQGAVDKNTVTAYRLDINTPIARGAAFPSATLSDEHAASLQFLNGHMTAFIRQPGMDGVIMVPMDTTPIAACGTEAFGDQSPLTVMPSSFQVTSVNMASDLLNMNSTSAQGLEASSLSPLLESPICARP